MVMIEAMALGCPVIAFARGAAPEIVVHRKTGFLVHDVREMIQFMPKVQNLDRAAIRAHVERNFSVRAMAEKYVKLYKKVIAGSAAPSASRPVVIAPKPQKSLVPPAPLIVKKDVPVRLPYQPSRRSRAAMEAEPTS